MKKPQFIIAAPTSNSGKTAITLGLLRLLEKRGFNTQAFKVGPDYIDPKFHKLANGKDSYNLDLFMQSEEVLQNTYASVAKQADVCCIEGVMGLFDGAKKAEGSTAALAKKLEIPVVLVVNAKSVAYSVAPLLYGFLNFDKDVKIAGVIFNFVKTDSHFQFLKEAAQDVGIPVLGYVNPVPEAEIPSRHLGLSIHEIEKYDTSIDELALAISKNVAIETLLVHTEIAEKEERKTNVSPHKKELKIAIAKDESFNFSYQQTVTLFQQLGSVCFFSPLHDTQLPEADIIYFPGGYPEMYVEQLSENKPMLLAVQKAARLGKYIIAECGGMMYLGKSIHDKEGNVFTMAHVFDYETSMVPMKLHLGYRTFVKDNIRLKGHEFHYSTVIGDETTKFVGNMYNAREKEVATKVYTFKKVKASYTHFYWNTLEELQQWLDL